MASKASKLMQGVNKTGKGLFAGMTPIGEQPSYENHSGLSYGQHEEKSVSAETRKEPPVRPAEKKPETTRTVIRQEAPKKTDIVKTEKQETKVNNSSRYEKDKFLLLDIRGYKDYIEHMAKAANMSATKYIRSLVEADMQKNMDIYEAHKELEARFKRRM